jgi:hypothetical protein
MNAIFASLFAVSLAPGICLLAQTPPRDLNTPRSFPPLESKAEWKKRAEEIREHVLMSNGLWPTPEKSPLRVRITDRREREGYSVENVSIETYPGFFLGGNLYRPLGRGQGPFPAVLNPHGHWSNGRFADEENGSIAARCIHFALQRMIALSYDMAGYNDTRQVDHKFASHPTNLLWNISLMGLQTWNSTRALDFLESLPEVDHRRLACTGESGGGTQTFILGAIDDRLAVQAPIVMVSHSMQGGCLCENAPGLRVDYSNMEIAAAPAPRHQVIVAATGDWTKKMGEVEGPAISAVYRLFGAADRFRYTIFDYPHNYNRTTREAVYASFNDWLLRGNGAVNEAPYRKEADADLRVFPAGAPKGALGEADLTAALIKDATRRLDALEPGSRTWQKTMRPAWEHALHLQHVRFAGEDARTPEGKTEHVAIRREPEGAKIGLRLELPAGRVTKAALLLGQDAQLEEQLRTRGVAIVTTDACSAPPHNDQFKSYFSTYNRTWVQQGAANIKAAVEYLRLRFPSAKIVLHAGAESAGPALLASPLADGVAADVSHLDDSSDEALLRPNSFLPGLRRIGSFQGALALAPKSSLLLHNSNGKLNTAWLDRKSARSMAQPASAAEIAEFIAMSMR